MEKQPGYKAPKPKPVSALRDGDSDTEDESDLDSLGGSVHAIWKSVTKGPKSILKKPPATLKTPANKFEALTVPESLALTVPEFETQVELDQWAHNVYVKGVSKQKKTKIRKDFEIKSDADVKRFENLFSASSVPTNKKVKISEGLKLDQISKMIESDKTTSEQVKKYSDRVWIMMDSGSTVNVANCSKTFPRHKVRSSKGSRRGTRYMNASGGFIWNEGEN